MGRQIGRLENEVRYFWVVSSGARKALYNAGADCMDRFPKRLDILSEERDDVGRRRLNPVATQCAGDPQRLDEWAERLDLLADDWGPRSTRAAARRALSVRRRPTPATVVLLPTAIGVPRDPPGLSASSRRQPAG